MNARELSIINKHIEEAKGVTTKRVYHASQNNKETATLTIAEIELINDCLIDAGRLVDILLVNTEVDNTTLKGFEVDIPF